VAALAQRTMQLQCTIQEGQVWLGDGKQAVSFELASRKADATATKR